MESIAFILKSTVRGILVIMQLLFLARAIISWLPLDEDSPVVNFLYAVTEPLVAPVRALFDRFSWFENLPIDMSFVAAFLILSILSSVL